MFLSKNKKNKVYPCKPQFFYIKVGFKRIKIIQACFCDVNESLLDMLDSPAFFLSVFGLGI